MRLSIAAYERLFGWPSVRAFASLLAWVRARLARVLRDDPYGELAALFMAWRALASVPPGDVPSCIRGGAERRIAELADGEIRDHFLRAFLARPSVHGWRREFAQFAMDHRIRMRYPRDDDDPRREGDLMILKPPLPNGEKGVLMVMYSPSIAKLVALFDHRRLAERYRFVLEPSTWGYQDPDLILYLHLPTEVVVQSQFEPDFEHVSAIGHNLVPVRVGAGDWVDSNRFSIAERPPKRYDVVMIASWLKLKRHALLFAAMRQLGDRVGRAALVGYPSRGRVRADVEAEARRAGVHDRIDWFENVSHAEVAEILQASRVSLMLSTREGASRAIYESLFCDVPVILTERNIGVNRAHINARTGLVAADDDLAEAIAGVLADPDRFAPRAWALANTGYANATRLVQDALREAAARAGEPWTRDILPKINAPNLRYVSQADWELAQPWYDDLPPFLRDR